MRNVQPILTEPPNDWIGLVAHRGLGLHAADRFRATGTNFTLMLLSVWRYLLRSLSRSVGTHHLGCMPAQIKPTWVHRV